MEEDGNGGNSTTNVDTAKADRSVWLMKCPLVVSKSWQSRAASSTSASDSHPVAKVVVSLDPLRSEDSSSLQVMTYLNLLRFVLLLLLIFIILSFNCVVEIVAIASASWGCIS